MELKKRLARVAAVSLTAGIVTIGGFGMAGVASADDGGTGRAPPTAGRGAPANGAQQQQSFVKVDLLALSAQKLGVSVDALRREMAQGRSIKQIAAQRGVAYPDIKTTLVNAEGADLQDATAKGTVTQAQANLLVSNIPQEVERFLTRTSRASGAGQQPGFGAQPGAQMNQARPGQSGPMPR